MNEREESEMRAFMEVMRRMEGLGWFEKLPSDDPDQEKLQITAKGSVAFSPLFEFLNTYNDEHLPEQHLRMFWIIVRNIHMDL